jgi:hypothetical protein
MPKTTLSAAELDSRKVIRELLGAGPNERTVDAVRRLITERDRLRLELADTGKALADMWAKSPAREEMADAN